MTQIYTYLDLIKIIFYMKLVTFQKIEMQIFHQDFVGLST